jgi:hypothetical protein
MVKKSILCFPLVTCARESVHALNGDDDEVTYSDNGRYKLNQEVRKLQQGWEEVIQKVDEKSLDVRSVMIL